MKTLKDIALPNSNLYLHGKGRDTNGNTLVKLSFADEKGFSFQSNNKGLFKTKDILSSVDNAKELQKLTESELETIEKEVVEWIKKNGSKTQKKKLKTYDKFAGGGNVVGNILSQYDFISQKQIIDYCTTSIKNEHPKYNIWLYDIGMGKSGGYGQYNMIVKVQFNKEMKTFTKHSTDSQLYDAYQEGKDSDKYENILTQIFEEVMDYNEDKLYEIESELEESEEFSKGGGIGNKFKSAQSNAKVKEVEEKLEKAKRQLSVAIEADEKAFAKSKITKLEKELAELKATENAETSLTSFLAFSTAKIKEIKKIKRIVEQTKKPKISKKKKEVKKIEPKKKSKVKVYTEQECDEIVKEALAKREKRKKYAKEIEKHPVTVVDSVKKVAEVVQNKIEDKAPTKAQAAAIGNSIKDIVRAVEKALSNEKDKKAFVQSLIESLKKLL